MIGRSLVIFQRGSDKNEVHTVNCGFMNLGQKEFDEAIVREAKEKNWKPEEIVNDLEVEKIVNATNCIGEEGHHRWASDGVRVINLSGDPNLYNPATAKRERKRIEAEKREQGLKKLEEFLPELVQLRKMVPEGSITIRVPLQIDVKIDYHVWEPISAINCLDESGKSYTYASHLIDRELLKKREEMARIVNCPHRIKYRNRCKEVADLLGLREEDIENKVYRL